MKLITSTLLLTITCFSIAAYADNGKTVYEKNCKMCHGAGMAGAPKTGDKSAWEERLAGGLEYLVKSAIEGKQGYGGMMPPRGGNPKLTDQDVHDAVSYMINQLK